MSKENAKAETIRIGSHEVHPMAAMFPAPSEREHRAMVEDMKSSGFDPNHPIIRQDGVVIDGVTRLRAAIEAGVEPVFTTLGSGEDALLAVYRGNCARRVGGGGPRAAAAVLIAEERGQLGAPHGAGKLAAKLAAEYGVSTRSFERALAVLHQYGRDQLRQVVQGRAKLTDFAPLARSGPRIKGRNPGTIAPKEAHEMVRQLFVRLPQADSGGEEWVELYWELKRTLSRAWRLLPEKVRRRLIRRLLLSP